MEKEQKEEIENPNKRRCSKCGSSLVYVRIRNNQLVCRSCSNVDDLGEVKDGKSN